MSDLLSLNEEGLDAFGPQPRFVTNSRLTRWCIAYIKKKKERKKKKILSVYSELSLLIKHTESVRLGREGIKQAQTVARCE